MSAAAERPAHFRPDIEGLRAIAVLAVLLFHMQVPGFGGGYTGVDIFNVISGFLITGLLVRELGATGRVDLPTFYFRRARRLLPAALTVIVVTLIASAFILSPIRFPSVAGDGAASAFYVANIRFAVEGTDYLASAADPSPYQHFWSLGVEEQFYLVWPLLVWAAARLVGVSRVGWVLGAVVVASFACSYVLTDVSAPWAFFSLPTRAWQLGAGGLVAIGIARWVPRRALPAVGITGLALVVAGVTLLNESVPYPGTAALIPTLGTMMLIVATSDAAGRLARVLGSWLPRSIGGISYSVYLWHWPLLILVPIALSDDSLALRLVLGAASIGCAIVSTKVIEAPFRFGRIARAPALRGVATGLAASLLVGTTALAAGTIVPDQLDGDGPTVAQATERPRPTRRPRPSASVVIVAPTSPAAQTPTAQPTDTPTAPSTAPPTLAASSVPTTGALPSPSAGTTAPPPSSSPVPTTEPTLAPLADPVTAGALPKGLTPRLRDVKEDLPAGYADGCHLGFDDERSGDCVYAYSDGSSDVMLLGDSHAAQWLPAIEDVGFARDWRVIGLTKSACPPVDLTVWNTPKKRAYRECDTWREHVMERMVQDPPAIVFLAGYHIYEFMDGDDRVSIADDPAAWADGLSRAISAIQATGAQVILVADTPKLGVVPDECLADHRDAIEACLQRAADVVDPTYAQLERDVVARTGARLLTLTDVICPDGACPLVFGTTPVYRDNQHLTATFARSLAPLIDAWLDQVTTVAPTTTAAAPSQAPDATPVGSVAPPATAAAPSQAPDATPVGSVAPPAKTIMGMLGQAIGALDDGPWVPAADPHGLPINLTPPLPIANTTKARAYGDGCHVMPKVRKATGCAYGDVDSDFTVLIMGDSHGAMWLPAFEEIAARRGWKVHLLTKSACPPPRISIIRKQEVYANCDAWRRSAFKVIRKLRPDLAILTSTADYKLDGIKRLYSRKYLNAWQGAWADTLRTVGRAADEVVLLNDVPKWSQDSVACLTKHADDVRVCATDRDVAVRADMTRTLRKAADEAGATFVDPSVLVCPGDSCPVVDGRYLVTYDTSHLTPVYARLLSERLEELLPIPRE